jgi:hypothetical protein
MRGIDAVLQGYTGYGEKAVRTAEPIRQAGGYKHSLRPGAGSGPIVGYIARQLDPLQWSDLIGRPRTHPQGARCATCGVRSRGPRPALGWSSRHGPVPTVEHVSNDSDRPMIEGTSAVQARRRPCRRRRSVVHRPDRPGHRRAGLLRSPARPLRWPFGLPPGSRTDSTRVHFGAVPTPPTRACGEPTARASATRRCTDAARP